MNEAWRPIAAALAAPDRRLLWARAVVAAAEGARLGATSLPARERRILTALDRAGLVDVRDDEIVPLDPFSDLLGHRPAAHGVQRFLRNGRIGAWPRRPADRLALLHWAAAEAIGATETLDEPTLTSRLATFSDDPATLRRDLVDAGLVDRAADGSAYRRTLRAP